MRYSFFTLLALAASGCGGHDNGPMTMTGPRGMGSQGFGAAFVSIAPPGGATGVSTSTVITLRFGAAMAIAMEQYVDLHLGSIAGSEVAMACSWSPDRTTLTCVPSAPLEPRTAYAIHLGGGMMTEAGQSIDYDHFGPGMGGQWLMGGMMGPNHGGHPWGIMGPGWRGSNGSYGMEFLFATA